MQPPRVKFLSTATYVRDVATSARSDGTDLAGLVLKRLGKPSVDRLLWWRKDEPGAVAREAERLRRSNHIPLAILTVIEKSHGSLFRLRAVRELENFRDIDGILTRLLDRIELEICGADRASWN
jgi:hypothetical protein